MSVPLKLTPCLYSQGVLTAQHQVNDLDALCAADFTRFKKVDLVFDDGFSGFPQLLADIRDLLRAASNVFRTAPPSPNPAVPPSHHPLSGLEVGDFLSVNPVLKKKRRVTSCLEELNLRFDLENLTMQSRPESTRSCRDSRVAIQYHAGDSGEDSGVCAASTGSSKSVYYAHIKYIWKLGEGDMEVLKGIDTMLSGPSSEGGQPEEGIGNSASRDFPHFNRLSTTCTFNPRSSFLLDEKKAGDVYEACKEFVQRGLPRLQEKGILRFAFEKV